MGALTLARRRRRARTGNLFYGRTDGANAALDAIEVPRGTYTIGELVTMLPATSRGGFTPKSGDGYAMFLDQTGRPQMSAVTLATQALNPFDATKSVDQDTPFMSDITQVVAGTPHLAEWRFPLARTQSGTVVYGLYGQTALDTATSVPGL